MERAEAIRRIKELEGQDLHDVARRHGVTFIAKSGKINKGWAGHAIEGHLGIPINSSKNPNLGSWELKVVPLKYNRQGELVVKETMAITMINPSDVVKKPFLESHLYKKLKRVIIVARIVGKEAKDPSYVHKIVALKLEGLMFGLVEADYLLVQQMLREFGFDMLTGSMGHYIQPRTKGSKGSKTRAFYARPMFLGEVLGVKYPKRRGYPKATKKK